MSSKHDPRSSLHDIIENARRAFAHVGTMDREAFDSNVLVRDAVERCIERVCEAVYRLGSEAEAYMPGQPWSKIRGMANRLRHAYHDIDQDTVWDTITSDLPALEAAAALALARLIEEYGPPGTPGPPRKDHPE